MKSKRLLLMLLVALLAPWAANAQQTMTVYENETGTSYVLPIYGNYADGDQHNQMIYPSTVLSAIGEGATISKLVFHTNAWSSWSGYTIDQIGTWTVKLGETTATTLDEYDETTTLTEVFSDVLVCNDAHTTITIDFTTNYTYNGGNLLVDITHEAVDPYIDITFLGKGDATSASYYGYQGWSSWTENGQNFLPRVTITHQGGTINPCQAPTLAEAVLTPGNGNVASLSWTENGESTSWVLQTATNDDFTENLQSYNIIGTPTKDLNSLTAEQTYYARVKPTCEGDKWSNPVSFTPTAAITATIYQNATDHCDYVPVYGYYADNKQQSEFIIPASQLSDLADGTIKAMTFYAGYNFNSTASFQVYLKEVEDETISQSTFYGTEDATTVYNGKVSISSTNGMTITFTNNYTYNGGNLLVGFYLPSGGNCSSSGDYFIGKTVSGASHSSTYGNNPTQRNFIPTTTFLYLPNPTPKPKNLHIVNGSLSSTGATLAWDAPGSATPTSYQYQYKEGEGEWTALQSTTDLSVALSLSASKTYTFQVRAKYDGVGESDFVETSFTTLDDCAYPTNLVATTTPGQGTKATLTWVKGYDEEAWVLEYATNNTFTEGLVTMTDGFTVEGNNVTANLTGLTAETHYYARVKANCDGPTSAWSNVAEFTPTNYVDFTLNEDATNSNTTSYTPFYANYSNYGTQGQFIVPATRLGDVAGGTIRRLTFYTNSSYANVNWGNAIFDVYVKEVENENFATAPATNEALSFDGMTNVYHGSLSVSGNQMVINFTEPFAYAGGNLMIGFDEPTTGTSASASWIAKSATNAAVYSYYSYSYNYSTYSYEYMWTASRNSYLPKVTFNYQPTPYKYPVIDEASCTFETTSAHIAWTVTGATPTGYQYQYKPASATEWPSAWTPVTTAYADLSDLTPGSFYDFRVKALYDGGNESVVVDYSFVTECGAITAFPWKEDFEAYSAGNFSHPCWVNEHISGDGSSIFKVYTTTTGSNTTHQLQLPDQDEGTLTKLRLPEMNLPNNNYQFVIDVYRSNSTYAVDLNPYEGIRVYASTDGNIDGATQLAFIPRQYDEENGSIPAEDESGWYTYELPISIQGTCYIILRGESQFCTSTYMDNLTVEQISNCARPSELAYSNVTNHSATIEWTAGDTEQTLWQIAYSKTSFDPNTANFDVTTVSMVDFTTEAACTYRFDKNLDAASTYYMYIRANCGTATEPDFGPWNRKGISFTTLAATPAPSNFVASNPASAKVDLVWNAGGGDFESWELYYVASETAPEAPTASTTATVSNITTLPTTEAPYVLDGLNPVTKYYAWIRAKHVWDNETTYSDWVALTGNYFETLDACPTPTNLVATNLTSVSADLSWVGSDDVESYTVQYRVSEQLSNPVLNEAFGSSAPTGWTRGNVALVEGVADVSASTSTSWSFGTQNSVLDGNHAWMNLWISSSSTTPKNYWLVTPGIETTGNQVLSFDVAYTAYSSSTPVQNCPTHSFGVYASTDKVNWTLLRVWNNSGSSYVLDEISNQGQTVSISLDGFADQTIYIGFLGHAETSNYDNNIHIDNVKVGTVIPAGSWANATTDETSQSYTLTGLTGGTKYDVHVKSNCTSGEYCDPVSFTTLAEGNKVFTNAANDGKWGNDNNWMPTGAPAITENAILRANATIESGCEAEAKKITFEGTPTRTLTIADGGQLKTDNSVTATVKKNITGYGESDGGYCLISTPISTDNGTASTYGMITDNLGSNATPATSTYDLYKWSTSSSATYDEWRNYRASTFSIANGTGYLYASKNGVELTFTGTVKANNTDVSKTPSYTTSGTFEFNGWNLYANPFVCDAYINDVDENESETPMAFYRMNEQGDGYVAATGAIHPMEGIFVQATKTGQSFKFTRTAPVSNPGQGNLNINLAQVVTTRNEQPATDNAIIRFGSNSTLEKFSFRENSSKIFIPMEGKDYAVVSAEQTGEIPVNFKAEKNGSYRLSFTSEEVTFSYLHLIDNMTGADVDLLANPTYSFDARTTDYESRFRLVFATGSSVDGDSFGFINGMGNLTIFGIEGEATLQVIDVTGRMLSSETFSGSYEKRLNAAPGVYMLRLIQGNDVKVQKMVVR